MITDEELHDEIRDRLRAVTAHLTLSGDPVPWVHARLRQRRIVGAGGLAAILLLATVTAAVLSVRATPTPPASRTTPTILQRFHAALMDAVSNSILKIDMHGDTVWVHQTVGRSVSANGLFEDVVTTHDGQLTATTVNYSSKTWSTSTISTSSVAAGGVPENSCIGFGYNLLTFADPTALQQLLRAEQFVQLPGTHNVEGQTTVELMSTCDGKPGDAAIYLNADTLVPVEVIQLGPEETPAPEPLLTFEVVPATPANLANLKLQLPSDFTEVLQGSG